MPADNPLLRALKPAVPRLGRADDLDEPLEPKRRSSLLKRIGGGALSGISAVGNLLDVPGSMVRDVLALENPVDQLLTPFSDENRTSGRNLWRKYGAIGPKDTWANWAGGLATEIALDPTTYLTLGGKSAVTAGGKALQGAGLIDDVARVAAKRAGKPLSHIGKREALVTTKVGDVLSELGPEAVRKFETAGGRLTEQSAQPVSEMFRVTFPFTSRPIPGVDEAVRGAASSIGLTPQRIARGFDYLGRKAAAIPGVSAVKRLFHAPTQGVKDPEAAAWAEEAFRDVEAGRAAARGRTAELVPKVKDLPPLELRRMAENIPGSRANATPEQLDALYAMDARNAEKLAQKRSMGIPIEKWEGTSPAAGQYFPRFKAIGTQRVGKGAVSTFGAFDPSQQSRYEWSRVILGQTETLSKISQDAGLNQLIDRGASVADIARYLEKQFGSMVPKTYLTRKQQRQIDAAIAAGQPPPLLKGKNTYRAMARDMAKLSSETRAAGIYTNHPLADFQAADIAHETSVRKADKVFSALAQPGTLKPPSAAARNPGTVTLSQALKAVGLKRGTVEGGGVISVLEREGLAGGLRQLAQADPQQADKLLKEFGRRRVDKSLVEGLATVNKPIQGPADFGELMGIADSALNLMKGMFTSPWPAFQVRNRVSGLAKNVLAGITDLDSEANAVRILRGGVVSGAREIPIVQQLATQRGIANLTDEAASDLIRELAYGHEVVGRYEGLGTALGGKASTSAGTSLDDILEGMPGHTPVSLRRALKKYAGLEPGTTINPVKAKYRGVGGAERSTFGPLAAGEDIGYAVEGANRLAPWLFLLKQGVDPAEAAKRVGQVQTKYGNRFHTRFENEVMKRLVPFYSFTRSNVGDLAKELTTKPGGRTAQTIRAIKSLRGDEATTPDYVAQTASIPLPSPDGQTDRYLTGLGLSFEDPLSLLGGGPRGAGLEVLSRLNPLIKGPLEYATGESFFQTGPEGGRALEDMDPTLGRILANVSGREQAVKFPGSDVLEAVLGNSPAARALTTARQITDKRKGLGTKAANLLTGLRVSDISPAAQDAKLRELVQQREKELGAKKFQKVYFPQDVLEGMTPRQREAARELIDLIDEIELRAKARKKARQKSA